jgi:hypothetical protein
MCNATAADCDILCVLDTAKYGKIRQDAARCGKMRQHAKFLQGQIAATLAAIF